MISISDAPKKAFSPVVLVRIVRLGAEKIEYRDHGHKNDREMAFTGTLLLRRNVFGQSLNLSAAQ